MLLGLYATIQKFEDATKEYNRQADQADCDIRDYGKKVKGITKPNIVMPTSGHVGVEKAAHLMNMDIKYVQLAPDLMPDMRAFEAQIDRNTVLLVASAPQYPQGLIEPIGTIGKLALKYDIPFHVDACLGGFLLAFAEKCDLDVEDFDFKVPGVTSISADTHKVCQLQITKKCFLTDSLNSLGMRPRDLV